MFLDKDYCFFIAMFVILLALVIIIFLYSKHAVFDFLMLMHMYYFMLYTKEKSSMYTLLIGYYKLLFVFYFFKHRNKTQDISKFRSIFCLKKKSKEKRECHQTRLYGTVAIVQQMASTVPVHGWYKHGMQQLKTLQTNQLGYEHLQTLMSWDQTWTQQIVYNDQCLVILFMTNDGFLLVGTQSSPMRNTQDYRRSQFHVQ